MYDLQWLKDYQQSQQPSFFPTYSKTAWRAGGDEAVDRFYHACVRSTGAVVLWDIVDAVHMIAGVEIDPKTIKPRSKYHPDMIRKQCAALESGGVMGHYDEALLNAAYAKVKRMFHMHQTIEPLEPGHVPYDSAKNSGLPYLLSKGEVIEQTLSRVYKIQEGKMAPQPTVLFHRGKNNDEARFVNGYPFEMSIIEGRFYYPFQDALVHAHTPYAGGHYDFELAGMLNEVVVKSRFIFELDYSKYDSSIAAKLSGMAFSCIRQNFKLSEDDEKVWQLITRYFHTSPMLAPDGFIYKGRRHGVPSGSQFTQVIDSIVNCILIEYAQLRMGFHASQYYVLGDDVEGGADRPVSLETFKEVLAELGITLNIEKSRVYPAGERSMHFLGHIWEQLSAQRDVQETLVKLVTPEKVRVEYFSKDRNVRRQAYIERLRSYQEDNPKSHALLQAVINFYAMSDAQRKMYVTGYQDTGEWYGPSFTPFKDLFYHGSALESNELSRWKAEKRGIRLGRHRGVTSFY